MTSQEQWVGENGSGKEHRLQDYCERFKLLTTAENGNVLMAACCLESIQSVGNISLQLLSELPQRAFHSMSSPLI
jgi:hypothetical protein